MKSPQFPRVSLALPLYHSAQFLDIIFENLTTLAYPNLEILVSDRHCADNAIEVIEKQFGSDPRFRFFRARDEIGWVPHYNLLLGAATGKYMLWMPHDDSYAPDYITVLADLLEQFPEALVAYGSVQAVFLDGTSMVRPRGVPFSNTAEWSIRTILDTFLEHQYWLAIRGLFRREPLVSRQLFLPSTRNYSAADMVWLYAVAATGRFVWTPDARCTKRFYPSSTHARWQTRTWRDTVVETRALAALLTRRKQALPARLRAELLVGCWMFLRFGANFLDSFHLRTILSTLPGSKARNVFAARDE